MSATNFGQITVSINNIRWSNNSSLESSLEPSVGALKPPSDFSKC